MERPHAREILHKTIPPLVVWGLTQLLESPRVAEAVNRVDDRLEVRKRRAARALDRVGKNARSNPLLLTVGLVAIVAGIGLVIRAGLED